MLEEAGEDFIIVLHQPLEYLEALVVVDQVVLVPLLLLILDPQVLVDNQELFLLVEVEVEVLGTDLHHNWAVMVVQES
jgi:hypothetical protein